MNALDAIARQVRDHPGRLALSTSRGDLSFSDLWRMAGGMAHNLAGQGVRAGDLVAVGRLPVVSQLFAILALARIGAASVSMPSTLADGAKVQLAQRFGVAFLIHGASESLPPGIAPVKTIAQGVLNAPVSPDHALPELLRGLGDQLWRIVLSSGTTGAPKGIPWTHGQRIALENRVLPQLPCGPGERLLVNCDLTLGISLAQVLTQLASGGALILPDRQESFLQAILRTKPTRVVTTTALAFALAEQLRDTAGRSGPIDGLRSFAVAGSAAPPALLKTLEEGACAEVVVMYGSSEVGTIALSNPAGRLANPATAGRILHGVDAQVVDDAGVPVAAGSTGLLRFRSPGAMATGYTADPQASARAFRDGWFYPGDRGAIDAGGNLTLAGRVDDVINMGGLKIDPARVEKALDAAHDVRESCVVRVTGPGARPYLVAAVVAGPRADSKELVRILRREVGAAAVLMMTDTLPKNDAGKVMRARLARRLQAELGRHLAGKYDFPHS